MQIKIVNVSIQKVKTYTVAEVTYEDFRGETKTWKLMSFANPATYAVLKDAKQGETFEITTSKNDKDYTVWTSASKVEGAQVATTGTQKAASSWVPDADRQRLIVKQSCLSQAVAFLNTAPDRAELNTADILQQAEVFVKYVYDVPEVELEGQE